MADLEKFEQIEIPQSHLDFAEKVADVADQYGIKEFEMTYAKKIFDDEGWDRRVRGDAKVVYKAVDGRGRPSRKLSVEIQADLRYFIISEPDSSD